jgi:cyclic beta-1,2-glucan synthetase
MLRLTLIENLHFVSKRIAWRRNQRDAALVWAERFLKVVETNPRQFVTALGDFVRAEPPLTAPFIAELIANIDGVNPSFGLALNWLEQELSDRGQTIERIQQSENQAQAANQVTTSNSITSIRALAAIDWKEFVESLSVTEAILRRDPAGVYPLMDFRTRNRYRTRIEALARACKQTEESVVETVVGLAAERRRAGSDRRESHVGFFLIDAGQAELEAKMGCRLSWVRRLGRGLGRRPLALYLLAIAALTAGLALLPAVALLGLPLGSSTALLLVATVLAVSKPALTLIHWLLTLGVPTRSLPSLDFSKGIPPEHRTIVVVPTLLDSPTATRRLLEDLEIRHLANKGPHLHFALLTDFPDADAETLPDDRLKLDAALQGIRRLNAQHAPSGETIFFLLQRPRKWNPVERKWMGAERKRGKLEDFNRLVLEGRTEAFSVIEGDPDLLRAVRYAITLDTDTQLPPGSAGRMAGAMAHLLNRPQLDPATRLVTCGYGVLQPRLAVSLTSAQQSIFSRLFAGEVGLDPYTREIANVYQDLFGQGQFVGKGIYDIQAFHAATGHRFPDNRILSHDLIEGCHARCGFLSDVELVENEPSRYLADAHRRHRWIRGDWQIASWLLARVPGPAGSTLRNPLSALARWMILDNLRRSLVPLATLVALITAWFIHPEAAGLWTLGLLSALFLPAAMRTAHSFSGNPASSPWRSICAIPRSPRDGNGSSTCWISSACPSRARHTWMPSSACSGGCRSSDASWSGKPPATANAPPTRPSPASAWKCGPPPPSRWPVPRGCLPSERHPAPSPTCFAAPGSPLPPWRGSSAGHATAPAFPCMRRKPSFSGFWRAAPGPTSNISLAPNTTGSRRTTSRKFRRESSRTGPRPPTSEWPWAAVWRHATSAIFPPAASSRGQN